MSTVWPAAFSSRTSANFQAPAGSYCSKRATRRLQALCHSRRSRLLWSYWFDASAVLGIAVVNFHSQPTVGYAGVDLHLRRGFPLVRIKRPEGDLSHRLGFTYGRRSVFPIAASMKSRPFRVNP
jgi:hypothetical protein